MTITANGDLHTATPAAGGPVQSAPVTVINLGGTVAAPVANGTSLSSAIDLGGARLAGAIFQAGFVGTSIGLQVSATVDGTYADLYDATGAIVAVICAASKASIIPYADLIGWRFVKVKTASAQTSDVVITLIVV